MTSIFLLYLKDLNNILRIVTSKQSHIQSYQNQASQGQLLIFRRNLSALIHMTHYRNFRILYRFSRVNKSLSRSIKVYWLQSHESDVKPDQTLEKNQSIFKWLRPKKISYKNIIIHKRSNGEKTENSANRRHYWWRRKHLMSVWPSLSWNWSVQPEKADPQEKWEEVT